MSLVKRRRRKDNGGAKEELYQIVQGKDVLVEMKYPGDGPALSRAQNLVAKLGLGKTRERPIEYFVRLVPVLGPPDDLYRLVLRPDGMLLTYRVGTTK